MTINGNTLTVTLRRIRSPQPEGYSTRSVDGGSQKKYLDDWHAAHPEKPLKLGEVETFSAPPQLR